MKLTPIHTTPHCDNAVCPTIYKAEDGSYVIQGFILNSKVKNELGVPNGEDIVQVPREFMESFLAKNTP